LPVFGWLQKLGQVAESEMYRTFNMGIGFVLVVKAPDVAAVQADLALRDEQAFVIGRVIAGEGVTFV